MATSLDQVNAERQVEANQGTKFKSEDVELAVNFGIKLLNEGGGLDLIKKSINQSRDPAQVIGQFLAQIISKLAEQMLQEYSIDPGIFLAKDGFLDYILNYIEQKLGYPAKFSDEIYNQVVEIIKAAAQGPAAPNGVMEGQPSMPSSTQQGAEPVPAPQPGGGMPPKGGM